MTASQREIAALGLHHSAYRCRDAEETRAFWEDRIGFPLVMALKIDEHPTTGEAVSYMHIFFDIGSHGTEPGQSNYLAFFDVPFRAADDPDELYKTRWGMDLHFAMRVADHDALAQWADRLSAAGVAHEGPIRHGICSSIYFHDPNGLSLRIHRRGRRRIPPGSRCTVREFADHQGTAHDAMRAWNDWKAAQGVAE